MHTDFDPKIILSKPLMVHLASNDKGSPRSSPLWFIYEEHKIWLFGHHNDSFVKRLDNEPVCALSVTDFNIHEGILLHVGLRGSAVRHKVCDLRLQRFLDKYLGPENHNEWFIQNIVNPLNVMLEIIPISMVCKNVSFFKTGPQLAFQNN